MIQATIYRNGQQIFEALGQGQRGGVGVWLSELEGWPGSATARTDRTDLITHGTAPNRLSYNGRVITLRGWTRCAQRDEVSLAARELSGIFRPDTSDEITLRVVEDGLDLQCVVEMDGKVSATPAYDGDEIDWEIPVYSASPYLYGPPRTYQIQPVGSGVGLQFPPFTGAPNDEQIIWFGEATNTQALLPNDGNANAHPVFEVQVDDGSGFRLTDGQRSVEWIGSCTRSVPVIVDMAGSVTVNGMDRSSQLTQRGWMSIPPHGSISVWLETLSGGTGSAQAIVRDTHI